MNKKHMKLILKNSEVKYYIFYTQLSMTTEYKIMDYNNIRSSPC